MTLETAVRRHLDPAGSRLGLPGDRSPARPTDFGSHPLGQNRESRPTALVPVPEQARPQRILGRSSSRISQSRRQVSIPSEPARPRPGRPADQVWNDWLTRPDESGRSSVVDPQTPGARRAVTRLVASHAAELPAGCSWLRLWPETGRTHQLRIQAARRGTPILGDQSTAHPTFAHPDRIALHARSLTIKHPTSGQELILIAPVPRGGGNRESCLKRKKGLGPADTDHYTQPRSRRS